MCMILKKNCGVVKVSLALAYFPEQQPDCAKNAHMMILAKLAH